MSKILSFIALFLVLALGFYVYKDYINKTKITALTTENSALRGNIQFMEKRLEKEHADTLAVSLRNKALEEEAAKDKAYFDWNYNIANTSVIKRLQAD